MENEISPKIFLCVGYKKTQKILSIFILRKEKKVVVRWERSWRQFTFIANVLEQEREREREWCWEW